MNVSKKIIQKNNLNRGGSYYDGGYCVKGLFLLASGLVDGSKKGGFLDDLYWLRQEFPKTYIKLTKLEDMTPAFSDKPMSKRALKQELMALADKVNAGLIK